MTDPREIPTVADYDHWGEEAAAIWYEENRYDMERGDEDPGDPYDEYEDDLDPTDPDYEAAYGDEHPEERVYTGGWE